MGLPFVATGVINVLYGLCHVVSIGSADSVVLLKKEVQHCRGRPSLVAKCIVGMSSRSARKSMIQIIYSMMDW